MRRIFWLPSHFCSPRGSRDMASPNHVQTFLTHSVMLNLTFFISVFDNLSPTMHCYLKAHLSLTNINSEPGGIRTQITYEQNLQSELLPTQTRHPLLLSEYTFIQPLSLARSSFVHVIPPPMNFSWEYISCLWDNMRARR
jgi:hypothetical protein